MLIGPHLRWLAYIKTTSSFIRGVAFFIRKNGNVPFYAFIIQIPVLIIIIFNYVNVMIIFWMKCLFQRQWVCSVNLTFPWPAAIHTLPPSLSAFLPHASPPPSLRALSLEELKTTNGKALVPCIVTKKTLNTPGVRRDWILSRVQSYGIVSLTNESLLWKNFTFSTKLSSHFKLKRKRKRKRKHFRFPSKREELILQNPPSALHPGWPQGRRHIQQHGQRTLVRKVNKVYPSIIC